MDKEANSCADPTARERRWWSKETVGIVTGGNKGIGYEIVKKLAEMGITVILTARDFHRGTQALHSLIQNNKSLHIHFFCLDVSNPSSIKAFVSWFSHNFSTLDILVNNAGVSFNEIGDNSVENAEIVMKTNYLGAKLLTESLLPKFRRCKKVSSRILNITSRLGSFEKVRNAEVRAVLERRDLKEEEIEEVVVRQFLEEVKSGSWRAGGWPEQWTDYAVSKLALNAYTLVLGRRYKGRGLTVNSYCPGFTKTSMTGGSGTHSASQAASFAVSILLSPSLLTTAHFYHFSASHPLNPQTFTHSKL